MLLGWGWQAGPQQTLLKRYNHSVHNLMYFHIFLHSSVSSSFLFFFFFFFFSLEPIDLLVLRHLRSLSSQWAMSPLNLVNFSQFSLLLPSPICLYPSWSSSLCCSNSFFLSFRQCSCCFHLSPLALAPCMYSGNFASFFSFLFFAAASASSPLVSSSSSSSSSESSPAAIGSALEYFFNFAT